MYKKTNTNFGNIVLTHKNDKRVTTGIRLIARKTSICKTENPQITPTANS